jgi:choice-of-anchor B domain-containing protein
MSALTRLSSAGLLGLCLVAPLIAHEDDPKILDRQPPLPGPGLRTATNLAGGPNTQALGNGGFDASGIELLSWITMQDLDDSANGNDCWGYVSPSGREYGIMCTFGGTQFIEITDPRNPVLIEDIQGVSGSLWRDAKVFQEYCYVVSEGSGSGIQVIDMGQIDNGVVTVVNLINDVGSSSSHNVVVDEDSGYLYRCGGASGVGLRIYDLNPDPSSPAFVSEWHTRYVHDAQVKSFTSGPHSGKQIAFCSSGFSNGGTQTGVDILDVTDKLNIIDLSRVFYTNPSYSHQGWLTSDGAYFLNGDEQDEGNFSLPTTTHVIDIATLTTATAVSSWTNGNSAVGHNMYTVGDQLFQANYRSGLRVFDVSNPLNAVETHFFDTYPGSDAANYNGLWSCYPFFPSGVVIGSDLERGFFVWWVGDALVEVSFPNGLPVLLDPAGQTVRVRIDEANPGDLDASSANLVYDAGMGQQVVPLTPVGAGLYDAVFPAIPCGDSVTWYIGAAATNGIAWDSPIQGTTAAYGQVVIASYDMEADLGWSVGDPSDDATTGIWERGNPNGTDNQPEDDHSTTGDNCWFTGQGNPGAGTGSNDVDGGKTTLFSPMLDMSTFASPQVSYWRWYDNSGQFEPDNDIFEVDITNDGMSWTSVEIVGPSGAETNGGWFQHTFDISQFVMPNSTVQLRFVASDLNGGTWIEAAIDDLRIEELDCSGSCGSAINYCTSAANSVGAGAVMGYTGSLSVMANNFAVEANGCTLSEPGLFYYGPNQTSQTFGDGFRCVSNPTYRLLPISFSNGSGVATFALDLTSPPQAAGQITPGTTWNFQFWYRDPGAAMAGFNLSDGLEATFCP